MLPPQWCRRPASGTATASQDRAERRLAHSNVTSLCQRSATTGRRRVALEHHDLGVALIRHLLQDRRMCSSPETPRERLVLVDGERLVAEEQHLVREPRAADLVDRLGVQQLRAGRGPETSAPITPAQRLDADLAGTSRPSPVYRAEYGRLARWPNDWHLHMRGLHK